MFTYSDNTNNNLNFYYFIVSSYLIEISFIRELFMCLMSAMEFSRAEYSRSQRPLSTKHPEFALSVAVVDTRSLAGARNHCEGSVYINMFSI
jgi:hypothetical protein